MHDRTASPARGPHCRARGIAPLAFVLLLVAACGGGGGGGDVVRDFTITLQRGPLPFAQRATLTLENPETISGVSFTVHSKPGALADDVHATYTRAYLLGQGTSTRDWARWSSRSSPCTAPSLNTVTIQVDFPTGAPITKDFMIDTVTDPPFEVDPAIDVLSVDPRVEVDYLIIQRLEGPTIVDIDGEIRWAPQTFSEPAFPLAILPDGLVVGGMQSPTIYNVDWMGGVSQGPMSDPRLTASHHNIEPGKTGLLNTIEYTDGMIFREESVLAEMDRVGTIARLWDFDVIFNDHITSFGEDPSPLVQNAVDWFHMNSAIYDASDDSIISSSRENFILKSDYTTGAIKWILGNTDKLWYQGFPLSLQPYALTVIGDPPIGQHSLSVSPDGTLVTCFNNGFGHINLPDIGDTRMPSKVSVYQIDEMAGTATEILALDGGLNIYSPVCSSAYWTLAGNMLATFSSPSDMSPPVVGRDQ